MSASGVAIARENFIPCDIITGVKNLGVVAFDIDGITSVSFTFGADTPIVVTAMALNPDSDTWEYYAEFDASDYSDGEVTYSIVVTPGSGTGRTLTGSVWANSGDTLYDVEYHVSNSGSDVTGDGSSGNPFETIDVAYEALWTDSGGNPGGGTILLAAGRYDAALSVHARRTMEPWLTVRSADGVAKEDVIIDTSTSSDGLRCTYMKYKSLVSEGISFKGQTGATYTEYLCCEDVHFQGEGYNYDAVKYEGGAWAGGVYIIDSSCEGWVEGWLGGAYAKLVLLRNSTCTQIGGDYMKNVLCAINCTGTDLRLPNGSTHHPDSFQTAEPGFNNVILYGCRLVDADSQGISLEDYALENVAIVNNVIHSDHVSGCNISEPFNQLLIWHNTFVGEDIDWPQNLGNSGDDLLQWDGDDWSDVSIVNNVFQNFVFTGDAVEAWLEACSHNHYIYSGSDTPGTSASTLSAGFSDPGNLNFTPADSSDLYQTGTTTGMPNMNPDWVGGDADTPNKGAGLNVTEEAADTADVIQITDLSVMGTPGPLFTFEPKGIVNFAADLSVTSAFTAALSRAVPLAADVAPVINLTAALSRAVTFATDITPITTLTAALSLSGTVTFAAALTPTTTLTAAITREVPFAAALTPTTTLTAALSLSGTVTFAAALTVTSTFTASIERTVTLSGAVAVSATLTADIERSVTFGAAVAASSTLTAAIERSVMFAAAVAPITTLSADITVEAPGVAELDAHMSVVSTFSADLSCTRPLSAALTPQSTLVASVSCNRSVSAALVSTSTFTATMYRRVGFTAPLAITSTLSASILRSCKFTAALAPQITFSASLSITGIFRTGLLDGWSVPASVGDWNVPTSELTWEVT